MYIHMYMNVIVVMYVPTLATHTYVYSSHFERFFVTLVFLRNFIYKFFVRTNLNLWAMQQNAFLQRRALKLAEINISASQCFRKSFHCTKPGNYSN